MLEPVGDLRLRGDEFDSATAGRSTFSGFEAG